MSTPAAPGPGGRPPVRIADRDRTAAAEALGEHFAAGRITREEYDERSERIWAAKVAADLQPLFLDLPAPHPPVLAPHGAPARTPGPTGPARPEWPGSGRGDARGRSRGLPPLAWVLLIVLGLALFAEVGWPILVVVAVLWWTGVLRPRRRHAHASGSDRPSRGSCW